MAEKVGGKAKAAPKTTVGPTRAAKGAGAGKNLRKPPEPKARIPEPKKAVSTPTPAPIPNDNRTPEERQKDFRSANLLKLTADHRKIENELSVLAEKVSEVNARKKQCRAGIETLGYSLEEFDRSMKDAGSSRIDLAQKERMRTELREIHATYVPPQGDLFEGASAMAEPARDAMYWELEGYRAGVHAERMEPQDHNVPPDMWQDFLRGVSNGQARNAWAGRESDRLELERVAAEQERKAAAGEADLVDQAQTDDDKSPDEIRRAQRQEEARARESLERLGADADDAPDGDAAPDHEAAPASTPALAVVGGTDVEEDEFEASEDELKAQRGRPAATTAEADVVEDPEAKIV